MSRPKKPGLDYFPKDVNFYSDRKIRRLLAKHDMQGVVVYDYMLCLIYSEGGYYIEFDNDLCFDISDALNYKVNEGFVAEVIKTCIEINLISKSIYEKHNKITSKGIQERYLMAKRNAEIDEQLNVCKAKKSKAKAGKPDKPKAEKPDKQPQPQQRPEHDKDKYINGYNKDSLRAFQYAKQQAPIDFQQRFEMKYWKQIKDKQKFVDYYNDMIDEQNKEYIPKSLIGALCRLANTWTSNQDKYSQQNQSETKQTSNIPVK